MSCVTPRIGGTPARVRDAMLIALVATACLLIAACGGAPAARTIAVPGSPPAQVPSTANATVIPVIAALSTTQLATAGGPGVAIVLPGATAGIGETLTVAVWPAPPPGFTALNALARRAPADAAAGVAQEYITVVASGDASYPGLPGFAAAAPTSGPAAFLAFFDAALQPARYDLAVEGPAAPTASGVVLASAPTPITFRAGITDLFALYTSSTAASPAPSPSGPTAAPSSPPAAPSTAPSNAPIVTPTSATTPTPTPTVDPNAIVLAPSSIAFSEPGQSATLLAHRANGASSYAATSSDPTVAQVLPSTSTTGAFTVYGNGVGTCTVTVTDAAGDSASATVSVAATAIIVR